MWAPDNAIMLVWVRLFLANIVFSWLRLKFGPGKFPATNEAFEISPSRRPNSTAKFCPPAYIISVELHKKLVDF